MAILVLALLAAGISFLAMGMVQWYRARELAGFSHERSLRFSRDDPFELPVRFGQFALLACGHSPSASNVAYGQCGAWSVKAFDFRYEVGHGTRRMGRYYSVVLIDTSLFLPEVLMWNTADADNAPLGVRQNDGQTGCWVYTGNGVLAEILKDAAGSLGQRGLSLQAHGCVLLLALPTGRRKHLRYNDWLDEGLEIADRLERSEGALREQASRRLAGLEF
jgi:hypothetical protein